MNDQYHAIAASAPASHRPVWQDAALALFVFLACMAFYAPTLSPSVVAGDGGEMQTQAQILGVTFPT
jgi:hypothetical protein